LLLFALENESNGATAETSKLEGTFSRINL